MPPRLGAAAVGAVVVLAPQAAVVALALQAPVAAPPGRVRRSTTARLMPVPTMSAALDVNNVNVDRDVNVNVEGHGGCCGGWDNDYHPVATAAAVSAGVAVTSAVVGSLVRSVPPSCVPVNYGGMVYQQCGSTWYQPQGSQYVVVNPPY